MFRPLTRIMILACLCLALAAPAAQAYPHGVHRHGPPWFTPTMTAQTTQQRPATVVITRGDGFDYLDAAVGAAIAAGLFGITIIAMRRPQTRVTA